jgi:hypothetical protein
VREKRSDPVADKLRLTQKHEEIMQRVMRALNSQDLSAQQQSVNLADEYRRMVGPLGDYNLTATFKEMHRALRNESKTAAKLAKHIRRALSLGVLRQHIRACFD